MTTRVYFGGATTDSDTADSLREVQRIFGKPILLTQGSYHPGYGPSGGTHDGGGVVDINIYGWNGATIWDCLVACRSVGDIAWHRTVAQGFTSDHIHVVRRDCADLSPSARAQVVQYLNGYSGLAKRANGTYAPDDGPQGYRDVTWGSYKNGNSSAYRPPINTDGGSTQEEDDMYGDNDRTRDVGIEFKANSAMAYSGDTNRRMQELQAEVDALKLAIQNIQFTSNAAYANAGQVLTELRDFVASQKAA